MWGQTTLNISSLSPKRDCGPKRVKVRGVNFVAVVVAAAATAEKIATRRVVSIFVRMRRASAKREPFFLEFQ